MRVLALDFKSSPPTVYYGDVKKGEKATTTVTVSDNDFCEIAAGTLPPQKVTQKISSENNDSNNQKKTDTFWARSRYIGQILDP